MGDYKINSLLSQVQLLMETQLGSPRTSQELVVSELKKMTNHFEFIGKLLSKGLLCDRPNDSEATMGLKELMVQLAVMIASSQGDGGIYGLMEALDESGNSELISAFQAMAMIKKDSGIENESTLSEAKVKGSDSNVQNPDPEILAQQVAVINELSSSGAKLIDIIMSRVDDGFMEQLEGHLVGVASRVIHAPKFWSHLVNEKVVNEAEMQLTTGSKADEGQWTKKAIKAGCSKRAIGSLVVALQSSGNERILQETIEWLRTGPARKKNYPISVKSLANQQLKQAPNAVKSAFFDLPAPLNGLKKIVTFNCQTGSSCSRGTFDLQFNKDQMIACSTYGTMSIWNLRNDEEKMIDFGARAKDITWFQCDEEIAVLGTAAGTVHLLDVATLEEKSTVSLDAPVKSLRFVDSTLVVHTGKLGTYQETLWWIRISWREMQLTAQRSVGIWTWSKTNIILFMDSEYCFLYMQGDVYVYSTKSGERIDKNGNACYLQAPTAIRTFSAIDLISTKANFIAGGENGDIFMWDSSKFQFLRKPWKYFRRHNKAAVVSLCGVTGHLLSLDASGELLMWSGHDLETKNKSSVATRVLTKNFCDGNATILVAYERWFASSSSKEGSVNIWALPELWLR